MNAYCSVIHEYVFNYPMHMHIAHISNTKEGENIGVFTDKYIEVEHL